MREAELMPLVFYESNEIAHPVEFVQNFLVLWEQDGREPFRMYTGSKAAPEITPGLLEARLTFSEKDKRDKLKSLRLKTSLKQNNIVATFLFEHPNSIPFAGCERRSSVSVDIPISKIKEEPYRPERLLEFFINLLSNKRVNQANIQIISTIEFEEGVNKALFDMLNYLRNKDYVFPARPLRWVTYFPEEEMKMIHTQFARIEGGFDTFCDRHGLYLQTLERTDGALIRMCGDPENTPEYFQRILCNNQDFYRVMKK